MSDKSKHNLKSIKSTIKGLLNGSIVESEFLKKQVPFISFLCILGLIYISNRYHAERIYRETEKTKKQIEDLRSVKIEIQSNLVVNSRRENLLKLLEEKQSNLIESKTAPRKILFEKFDIED